MTERRIIHIAVSSLDAAALRAAAALLRPADDPRSRPWPGDASATLLADTLDRLAGPVAGLRHTAIDPAALLHTNPQETP